MTVPLTDQQLNEAESVAADYAKGHFHLRSLCGPACAMAAAIPQMAEEIRRLRSCAESKEI
ncbi:hypothetical protein [Streptomyces sp. NPDC046862]|uniref:hypothetical protein n=1 Tax=Streptomyces sp. NPDC046862 TaxID=3154603 RepID=UPI003453B3C6